jgi:hypothetical protein
MPTEVLRTTALHGGSLVNKSSQTPLSFEPDFQYLFIDKIVYNHQKFEERLNHERERETKTYFTEQLL